MTQLVDKMLHGDPRALARLMSIVESGGAQRRKIMAEVYPHANNARVLGITGPPGAGKSTLADRLISRFRSQDKQVGVLAIDPSSPFSGGALLGDRIRMSRHAGDRGVFIRSLGTRGNRGGLARATREFAMLLSAFGKDVVIVETVGVGQTELDIMDLAHSVLVVFVPESGDVIQTMKAGLTEIADIFVVNKADREGADRMVAELRAMVEMNRPQQNGWTIPVLQSQAFKDVGVEQIAVQIDLHWEYLQRKGNGPCDQAFRDELCEVLLEQVRDNLSSTACDADQLRRMARVSGDEAHNPYLVAERIVADSALARRLILDYKADKSDD
ncbi:MAG: methylmalonyl Co-A mutase-associated GTPase MeaB [Candidatus Alcyoniella australis]|nr:methylmalonyl Co-A mutase-associated GTPase MeaB [Candidatus Alcyoniella australis]